MFRKDYRASQTLIQSVCEKAHLKGSNQVLSDEIEKKNRHPSLAWGRAGNRLNTNSYDGKRANVIKRDIR